MWLLRATLLWIAWIATALLLGIGLRALAQRPASAWVYNPETGHLLLITPDGAAEASQRMVPPPGFGLPESLIIAPDGSSAAFLVSSQNEPLQQLLMMDLSSGAIRSRISLDVPDRPLFRDDYFLLTPGAFSPSSERLAVTAVMGGLGWRILLINAASGTITHTLAFDDALVAAYPVLDGGSPPIVQSVTASEIILTIDPALTPVPQSFRWVYTEPSLLPSVAAPSFAAAVLPATSEIISPLADRRFPSHVPHIPGINDRRNALHIYDSAVRQRFPIFTTDNLQIERAWFVQGGEALLLEAATDAVVRIWVVVGRGGEEQRRMLRAGSDVAGVPDGFLYTTPVNESTALVAVDTRADSDSGHTVWVQEGHWRLVWAENNPQAPLPAWLPLAEALSEPVGTPLPEATPTVLPSFPSFRAVGMAVQIYTADDEFLNMRDEPGTASNVLALLESGTQATIVGGPEQADGFTWWEIQVGIRRGWVVQALPDVLALIPPQAIPEKTEEPERSLED